ncbi:sporulation and spore germination [Rubidibacter lacunae KORDI 51-2]|uniref:Sporulation and spore germination n=1 Tax=Rubidibacter lacunae KORDI 51-2 TaxID=582515 RepID=U5DM00_9CHRO|nr:GerMN domain-containing protein [Rubidibacter lacunae]ERN42701.1 sporulation and spore germination [Rubidibacter lacunae KORDI 51-2]
MSKRRKGRFSAGVMAGIVVGLLGAGGFAGWWAWQTLVMSKPPWTPGSIEQPDAAVPVSGASSVYWLRPTDTSFELVARSLPLPAVDTAPQEQLKTAFSELLDGPGSSDYASTIPEGTKLRDLSVRADGIYIDLTEEFQFGGGSASMQGRLAQVLYTATSLDPNAKVYLRIEGEPVEYLGGEGIAVEQPLTRKVFARNHPL